MRTTNFFQLFLSLVFVLSLTSCTQSEIDQPEDTNSFNISTYNQNKTALYTNNYVVSNKTTSIDITNNEINLEIPIPKGDFHFINTYNISSKGQAAILYLIGRNSTDVVVNNPISYLINDTIKISEIGLDTNLLQNGNGLRIFVMNRSTDIDTDSTIFNCLLDKVENNDFKTVCTSNNKSSDGGPDTIGDFIIEF